LRSRRRIGTSIASEFCTRFGLLPSEGPYIVVTTRHPSAEQASANRLVVSLKGLNPARISEITDKLTDQITLKGLNQQESDSEVYWTSWKSVADNVWGTLSNELKKIKISIDAKFFKIEYSGGSS
jgi:hypothetical protein